LLSSCDVKITKVGCYNDDLHTPRPLPDLILTDRDPTSDMYDGHRFDWEKTAQSMNRYVYLFKGGHYVFEEPFFGQKIVIKKFEQGQPPPQTSLITELG